MKKVLLLGLIMALFVVGCKRSTNAKTTASSNAETTWLTDFKEAQRQAKDGKKMIFLDFTGSDWCPPCIMFQRNFLSKPKFKDYANKNLVLMEVDFPRAKAQSATLREQNMKLGQRFQIYAFPTVIVLNSDGRKVWEYEGYFTGSVDAFIAQLEKLRKG